MHKRKSLKITCVIWLLLVLHSNALASKTVAYIYGNVASDGTLAIDVVPPAEPDTPYDQMLLTDTGNNGLSMFKELVEAEGYTIDQYYDQTTTLDAVFLAGIDVIVFGLHQKVWSSSEQTALDTWIRAGGGILMYSDSAAGGLYSSVGIGNTTGKNAVNSILSNYGMEVTVDQGGGVRAYEPNADQSNPIIWDQLIFEGEGVSPVAVDPASTAEVLIPLDDANLITNTGRVLDLSDDEAALSFSNPEWACMALNKVGAGHVMAVFDRQPFWNNGPGSDIEKRDNTEVLRRVIRYLARDYGNSDEWLNLSVINDDPTDFQISYRQWSDGSGQHGFDYNARNNRFALLQRADLATGDWRNENSLQETVQTTPYGDDESEITTVRILPDAAASRWFTKLSLIEQTPPIPTTVEAGYDSIIELTSSVSLAATTSNANTVSWAKTSGPGTVGFANSSAATTTATFSTAGSYVLSVTAVGDDETVVDSLTVTVVSSSSIIAINCGGDAYSSSHTGIDYLADTYNNGGGVDNFPGNAVSLTEDDSLYNTARSKSSFTGYSIPVPSSGDYTVMLQFAETFWTSDNSRVFDLSLEGNLVLDDLDLHATAGGKWVAYNPVFEVNVSDGTLDITVSASANNALINAIVVVPSP